MTVKEIWTDREFQDMGWHDSQIYSMTFPNEKLELKVDVDYIFKWDLDDHSQEYNFWVAPCEIIFYNVLYFNINLDFQNNVGISIININREHIKNYSEGNDSLWRYLIETDKGIISFESTGFLQIVKKQPVYTKSQKLDR